MPSVADALGANGALSQSLSGFAPRQAQIEMADAVALAIEEKGVLVAEAGTGIGKTFAYLAPAMLSGSKCIISTGTKHLQDQLFKKDLPTLQKSLRLDLKAVLLKGRANYLCLYRLGKALSETRRGHFEDFAPLRQLDEWGAASKTGDKVEFTRWPEDHHLWPRVTSTSDNCVGQECPDYKQCFVVKARRAALEADLVVINHHLFCADLALKESGFGEILPSSDAIILDEAHQLPEVATRFFGKSISGRQLLDLCNDVNTEAKNEGDMPELELLTGQIAPASNRLRMTLGRPGQRAAWLPMLHHETVKQALDSLYEHLSPLVAALDQFSERSGGMSACFRRAKQHLELLESLQQPHVDYVHWFETNRTGYILRSTPLDISAVFQNYMGQLSSAWVFTSATLAVGKNFQHFTRRLGIDEALTRQWTSPFDYQNNALLYLPTDLPFPQSPAFTSEAVRHALPLINANPGGTFFLFTSYRALQAAAEELRGWVDREVLVQGDAPRQELIERFRQSGNALLIATSSFWEGVDVRGQALSCVIIDKLPFASPGDPVLEARLNAMKEQGGSPFMDFQLPQAVISLKQGAGRLIRDITDEGLLAILDPRLTSKSYGRQFLASIPNMPRTHLESDAVSFLQTLKTLDTYGLTYGYSFFFLEIIFNIIPMIILALDTSSEASSVALWKDGAVESSFELTPREHTGRILPMVDEYWPGLNCQKKL